MTGIDHARKLWLSADIRRRVRELGALISSSITDGPVMCLVVLRGGFFFAADLIRELQGLDRVEIEFARLASYMGTSSSGEVKFRGPLPIVAGRHVLVIEDLLDTGQTLACLGDALHAAGAARVEYAVLVQRHPDKKHPVTPTYTAFTLESDDYLFGYGMDFNGLYRELPDIYALVRE